MDRELGGLEGDLLGGRALLSYLRYDARLEPDCLERMGLPDLAAEAAGLREMDTAALRGALDRIGQAAAGRTLLDGEGRAVQFGVEAGHFPPAFDLPG